MSEKREMRFVSDGQSCRGDLYLPDGDGPFLTLVMGHGFGLTKECGLDPFRDAFLAAGYAVFMFDYRHFGESEGVPRQVLMPNREVADWQAALACVRKIPEVDNQKIVLWGTSFAGGLVSVVAGKEPVAGIISQCPMMDGLASVLGVIGYAGLGQGLKMTGLGLLDLASSAVGMGPKLLPSAGRPGELAAMSSADAWDGYTALMPDHVPNEVAARIALVLPLFRPVTSASKVTCPALILICETDSVAPASAAEKAAAAMANATVKRYPVGHFDVYQGEAREISLKDQLAFLKTLA
ncbi:alpha/beta hydrolase [Alcanivorax sediminis]|uniref:Alpha/beta fold hydrolase n=2 Tax=Alcanivorax sediminis TaxID=2663008 RepID=A0A6N7LTS6_9GAMM|nr:alpha/beta fold hydrolase [Alcanivorax sediminis]